MSRLLDPPPASGGSPPAMGAKTLARSLRDGVNGVDFNRFRFWLQVFFFAFLVYGGFLGIDLGHSLPTFSCVYNGEGRPGMCYLAPLQHQLAQPWPKLFGEAGIAVLTGFSIFFLWFIALNKGWCGFVCPLGTIQDWITGLRKRLGRALFALLRDAIPNAQLDQICAAGADDPDPVGHWRRLHFARHVGAVSRDLSGPR